MDARFSPSAPTLEQHRLDNGLQVVLVPDASLPLVAVNLWYHVGSKNEAPERTGLAHLFEHMLFQGSAHVDTNDHFRFVQQVGGVANGSTWFDRTNYYETLPSSQLELGLWLESDRMGFLLEALTPEKLENQRDVVLNERRQRVDNQPYGRAFERLHELLYPSPHPYHWPVIGYEEDIAAATLEEVRDFFSAWYGPNNAVLTLLGDFETSQALERADAWFGPLPRRPTPARPDPPFEPLSAAIREELADTVPLTRLYIGLRCPGYGRDDWYAAGVLSTLLSTGKSSPLYRQLVWEKELAKDATSFLLPTELSATFGFVATLREGIEVSVVEEILWRQIEALARGEVTEVDLERATHQLLTSHLDALQQAEGVADAVGRTATFLGDPSAAWTETDRYLAVDREALASCAGRWLQRDHAATLIVVPR